MNTLKDKAVLVTGGTGSVGKALVTELINRDEVGRVTVFSRDESKQWELENELPGGKLNCVLGDIRDQERVMEIASGHDIFIHTAALKHVAKGESFPSEFLKTNVLGTQHLIKAARQFQPETFLFLSTDKAVNPSSNYGSGKLTAEKMITKAGEEGPTKFVTLRLGNILGTRGTVLQKFLRDRKEGVLQVTDLENTRFCLSVEQAVTHIYFTLKMAQGGEIFVPKLRSFQLLDLVRAIDEKCELIITGLKKGEKRHESLLAENELKNTIENDAYYIVCPDFSERDKYDFCRLFGASFVNETLQYRSDLCEKITKEELQEMIMSVRSLQEYF